MPVAPHEFQYLSTLLRSSAGLVLDAGKEYLVEARLAPLATTEGFKSLNEMIATARISPINGMHRKIVDAMTTNETSFFRDFHPFETLRTNIFPALIARRASRRTLNIWCGAASTGQEPYSIAMVMHEHFPWLSNWTVRMLATDLNTEVLDRARSGRFRQLEVNRGLPAPLLVKYFHKRATLWEIRDEIRRMVDFREMNLATSWPSMPRLDLVFLRNVMIYFDTDMKRTILGKIRSLLEPDGYLFLGSSETTINLDDQFEPVTLDKTTCYKLKSNGTVP